MIRKFGGFKLNIVQLLHELLAIHYLLLTIWTLLSYYLSYEAFILIFGVAAHMILIVTELIVFFWAETLSSLQVVTFLVITKKYFITLITIQITFHFVAIMLYFLYNHATADTIVNTVLFLALAIIVVAYFYYRRKFKQSLLNEDNDNLKKASLLVYWVLCSALYFLIVTVTVNVIESKYEDKTVFINAWIFYAFGFILLGNGVLYFLHGKILFCCSNLK